MNDPRHDEFQPLDGEFLSGLYRETCNVDPPDELDQRILTAAQIAVKPRPTPVIPLPKPHRARRWTLPIALAATVVLAVGLIRVLPPAGERSGMPAALEEKAARSLSRSAAGKDAPEARRAESTMADHANRADRASPTSILPATPAVGALQSAPLATPKASAEQRPQESLLRAAPAKRDVETVPDRDRARKRPPAEWLAEIAELRRQGRTVEAEARLTEFRQHYPDEPSDTVAEPPR